MDADVIVFFYDPFPLSSFKKKTHKSKDGFTRLRSHDSFRFKLGFQRILDLFSFQLSRFFLVAPLSGIKKVPISLLRFNRMFDFDLVATGVVAFLGSLVLSEILILGRNVRNSIKKLNPFAVLFALSPMFLFFLWNFRNYGNILGVRFIFNYGNDNVAFLDRILRFFSITFVNYVDGIPKFGLFFCSSFLLLPVLYYVFFKNKRSEKINFLLIVIGLNTVLVGILSPNDGITITGRYLILTIIPLLILWENWKPHASKIWKVLSVTLIVFSLLISGLILKILQHSTKQERIYRDFYARNETSLWIFMDPILCGQAGSDHLSKRILCFNSETNLDRILKKLESEPSVSSLTVFEMNEKEFRNFENKIPMILSSESRTILKEKLNLKFQKEKNPSTYKGVVATRYDKRP